MEGKRVLGYVREVEGVPVDVQKTGIEVWCSLHGHELVDIVVDDMDSIGGRYLQLKNAVESHTYVDAIVMYYKAYLKDNKISELINIVNDITDDEIQLIVADFPEKDAGRIAPAKERAVKSKGQLISQRTKEAQAQLRKAGIRYSRVPPYGYKYVGSKMVSNEREQEVIAIIKELTKEGYSNRGIAGELNKRGYLSRVGTPISHGTVIGIKLRLKRDQEEKKEDKK